MNTYYLVRGCSIIYLNPLSKKIIPKNISEKIIVVMSVSNLKSVFFMEELNVGTVPTFEMNNIETVPMFKAHNVGTKVSL